MKRIFFFVLFVQNMFNGFSQTLFSPNPIQKLDYCIIINFDSIIGTYVKIWDINSVYIGTRFYREHKFWKKPIKREVDKYIQSKFRPKTGDIGQVKYIKKCYDHRVKKDSYLYFLNIQNHLVPADCFYLTDTASLNRDQLTEIYKYNDSLRRVKYAGGCEFKDYRINGVRTGVANIDIASETFACNLKDSLKIDTIMLCKHIYDNGLGCEEKAFVLWRRNSEGYIKTFYNKNNGVPKENKVVEYDWVEILNSFVVNRIDTITTYPYSYNESSHGMGYSVQLLITGKPYYCFRWHDCIWEDNFSSNPRVLFWKLIDSKFILIKED